MNLNGSERIPAEPNTAAGVCHYVVTEQGVQEEGLREQGVLKNEAQPPAALPVVMFRGRFKCTPIVRLLRPLPWKGCLLGLFCFVVWQCFGASCGAAEWKKLNVGFHGLGRTGHSMPVIAEVDDLTPGQQILLTVTALDPRGNLLINQTAVGTVAADGSTSLRGQFAVGRLDGQLRIAVRDAQTLQVLIERSIPVNELSASKAKELFQSNATKSDANIDSVLHVVRQSTTGLLTVGELAGLRELQSTLIEIAGDPLHLLSFHADSDAEFPDSLESLQCIDVIVLEGKSQLNERQTAALQDWVGTGGHLVVSCGAQVADFLQSSWGKWVGHQFELDPQPVNIRDLSSLQNYVPSAVQLSTNRRSVLMSRVTSENVKQVVSSLDGPIVARTGVNEGLLTMVTVDLNQRPLNSWKTLPRFYEMLIFDQLSEGIASARRGSSRIASSGVSDLSTQLATAYDAVPPEERWSAWHVMAMMIVYLILIGPLDYLLVTRLLGKPHLTWLTFPAFIGIGVWLIYGETGSDSPQLTSREMHVLDISQNDSQQLIHARSFTSLSSELTQRSTVMAQADKGLFSLDADPGVHLNWYGRAENVYGGMYREGGAGLGRQTYDSLLVSADPATSNQPLFNTFESRKLARLPMLAAGSQALSAEWISRSTDKPLFKSELVVLGTGLLEGDVHFNLGVPMRDWLLFYGNRVYQPGPKASDQQRMIQPGETWNRRNDWVRASDLKSFLNGVRIVQSRRSTSGALKADSLQVTTPYNPRSSDPLEILTMISLFEAAGGEAYAGLTNDSLRRLEVSENIRMNSALLLARVDQAPTRFVIDDQTAEPVQSQTIIRMLLPVNRKKAAPQASINPENEMARLPAGESAAADDATLEKPSPDPLTSEGAASGKSKDSTSSDGSTEDKATSAQDDVQPAPSLQPANDIKPVGPELPKNDSAD